MLDFSRKTCIYYVLGTALKQFETLKKIYSRKKVNTKTKYTPGTGAPDISKVRNELEEYSFSPWLDPFTRLRKKS